MRFISKRTNGYKIYAVTGINTVSFAIDFATADTKGLLGFAIERQDITANQRYFMYGFKVFKDTTPDPNQNTSVSTYDHPVQSFVWDDFTGKPGHQYQYLFYPIKGTPKHLDHSAAPVVIAVQTEPLFAPAAPHDVFFNRGVASSQAYTRKFGAVAPSDIADPTKAKQAYDWLARDLQAALIAFIDQAKAGDTLLACFYEFRHAPIAQKFKDAIDRGVNVRIIIDAKRNKEDFPRADNLHTIQTAGIAKKHIILRQANQNDIQHNKFIVFLKNDTPTAVWTGSTNISDGGLFGQTNVGHWVRDTKTAEHYEKYWNILRHDPGGKAGEPTPKKSKDNKAFKQAVVALQADIEPADITNIPQGITPIFSPRASKTMLSAYAALLDSAEHSAAITLAFGIADVFKDILVDNTVRDHIIFILLEKQDKPRPGHEAEFTKLTATHNIYEAWGSYIKDPLYQWTKEVNTKIIKLNNHVLYIHSKFMLVDPLGDNPLIVTGSANFSTASTTSNDENMIIIKGDKRAADIYFTEFNRLFNHYYFRSVYESLHKQGSGASQDSLFLLPNDTWIQKYDKGKLRYKRIQMFRDMKV